VDDNADILSIFSLFFRRKGYHVITAGSGQDCLDITRAYVPDLILLDVMMEPMDGWQTLMTLKKNPDTTRIPVIMVSGKKPTPDDIVMYGRYYEHFIMKPVSFPVLFDIVTRVLPPQVIPTR
jgi:two-component system, OmpR family, response regulator